MKRTTVTPAKAIRQFCAECIGPGEGYDCDSAICPLRSVQPWRGKPMSASKSAEGKPSYPANPLPPKERPALWMIPAYCGLCCQPEDRDDCGGPCPFYRYHPWNPDRLPTRMTFRRAVN